MDHQSQDGNSVNILTLDGRGVRGYVSLVMLKSLMKTISEVEATHPETRQSNHKPFEHDNSMRKPAQTRPVRKIRKLDQTKGNSTEVASHLGDQNLSSLGGSEEMTVCNGSIDDTASSSATSISCFSALETQSSHTSTANSICLQDSKVDSAQGGGEALFIRHQGALPPRPCDYFDSIIGTSTELLATMLGTVRMSADECLESYAPLMTMKPLDLKNLFSHETSIQMTMNYPPGKDWQCNWPSSKNGTCDHSIANFKINEGSFDTHLSQSPCLIVHAMKDKDQKMSNAAGEWLEKLLKSKQSTQHPHKASGSPGFLEPLQLNDNGTVSGGVYGGTIHSLYAAAITVQSSVTNNHKQPHDPIFLMMKVRTPRACHKEYSEAIEGGTFDQIKQHGIRLSKESNGGSDKVGKWLKTQSPDDENIYYKLDGGEKLRNIGPKYRGSLESLKSAILEYLALEEVRKELKSCALSLVKSRRDKLHQSWARQELRAQNSRQHVSSLSEEQYGKKFRPKFDARNLEYRHQNRHEVMPMKVERVHINSSILPNGCCPSEHLYEAIDQLHVSSNPSLAVSKPEISEYVSQLPLSCEQFGLADIDMITGERSTSVPDEAAFEKGASSVAKAPPNDRDCLACNTTETKEDRDTGLDVSCHSNAAIASPMAYANSDAQQISKKDNATDYFDAKMSTSAATEDDSITDESLLSQSDDSLESHDLEDGHPYLHVKDTILQEILKTYNEWQNTSYAGDSVSGSSLASQTNPSGTNNATGRSGKRKRSSDDDSGLGDDASSNITKSLKQPCISPAGRSFACPFCKKDPNRYRECYSYKLSRIGDVKQHLQRRHPYPIYCPTCMAEFKDETERDNHSRLRTCLLSDVVEHDGITESQKRKLGKKIPANLPDEQQWYKVWDILFPGRPRPTSVYIDHTIDLGVQRFRDFMEDRGPSIIGAHLDPYISSDIGSVEADRVTLRNQIMREAIQRVIQEWDIENDNAQEPMKSNSNSSSVSRDISSSIVFSSDNPTGSALHQSAPHETHSINIPNPDVEVYSMDVIANQLLDPQTSGSAGPSTGRVHNSLDTTDISLMNSTSDISFESENSNFDFENLLWSEPNLGEASTFAAYEKINDKGDGETDVNPFFAQASTSI